ncbi:MAG: hypothetical protein ACYS21_18360 [Planctomycetota bacterium]|jgi:hypothetical protein
MAARLSQFIRWRTVLIILVVLNVYCITFFFAFHAVFLHNLYVRPLKGTGPAGTTVVVPSTHNPAMQRTLFTIYYPLHSLFKYKEWIWPLENERILVGDYYEDETTQ